jgi:hypothetical protein
MVAIDADRREIADPGKARRRRDRLLERAQGGIAAPVRRNRGDEQLSPGKRRGNRRVGGLAVEQQCADALALERRGGLRRVVVPATSPSRARWRLMKCRAL